MKNISLKKLVCYLAIASMPISMIACGGSSSNGGGNNNGVSLTLTAPSMYPAGSSSAINAMLTINNTSNESALGLQYSIPAELNTTGVDISVLNDDGNPCKTIQPHSSCVFPVTISPKAHAGSFGVSVSEGSLTDKLKSAVGLKSSSTILTANIGLTSVAPNLNLGADGITFLYDPVVTQNPDGSTAVTITAVVGENAGGVFDEILLTDGSGNPLNFTSISGNSGAEYTNLNAGAVVTLVLQIPAGQTSAQFYAKTQMDGKAYSQGTISHTINLVPLGTGILSLSPTSANLTPTESTVTLLYTNKGTGNVDGINVGTATSPMTIDSNSCSTSLSANSSCKVVLKSNAGVGSSGTGSFTTSSTGGSPLVMNYNYVGLNPESGFTLQAVNSFNFTANTVNTSEATQVTLTNTSNTKESEFDFSFNPNYFTINAGEGNNSCIVSGNKVMTELAAKASCSFTLIYTNAVLTPASTSDMTVNYKYHGDRSGTDKKTLSYTTAQAKANLSIAPLIHNFGTIVANGSDSSTFEYTVTNAGPDAATNLNVTIPSELGEGDVLVSPFSVSENRCTGDLAAGSTCKITVKYGPTVTVVTTETAQLSVGYKSVTNGDVLENTKATANGSARAIVSANPVVTNVVFSPAESGGDGKSNGTAFAVAQGTNNQYVTLTYKNQGNTDATNFTVGSSTSEGYTFEAGGSTCNTSSTLQKNSGNSCTMKFKLNTVTSGERDLNIANNKASWSTADEGALTNQTIIWNGNSSSNINVSVYELVSVTAQLLDGDNGNMTPPYIIDTDGIIKVRFNLTGGYAVSNKTYTVRASVFSPNEASCNVSSVSSTCTVDLTAPSTASDSNTITVSGDPSPIPSSFNVDVKASNKWVFVSQSSMNGAMLVNGTGADWQTNTNGGVAAADEICQHDAGDSSWIPADKGAGQLTWKAMLATSARTAIPTPNDWVFAPGTAYKDIISNRDIGVTNEYGVFDFPLDNVWGSGPEYYTYWDGYSNQHPVRTWTGLDINWNKSSDTCAGFTAIGDGEDPYYGRVGTPVSRVNTGGYAQITDDGSIDDDFKDCADGDATDLSIDFTMRIVCVSQ